MIASVSIIIAASTACSASSEYGGKRSAIWSRSETSAIEEPAGMLDVIPGGAFPGGIAQKRGGVVRHDQGYSVVAVHSTTEFADRQLGLQKRLGGECSESQNDLGADQLDLADEI